MPDLQLVPGRAQRAPAQRRSSRGTAPPDPTPALGLSALALGEDELVHDLRKELAVMRHLVGALQCSVPLRPDLIRLVSDLAHEVAVADDLVLSSVRAVTPEAVDVVDLVRGAVAGAAAVHRGRLELRCTTVPRVRAPAVLLRRAVVNLLVNACEAAGDGTVAVTVGLDTGCVLVDVDDDGASSRPPDRDGLGLGQWIVHAVVRDCGGTVERGTAPLGGRRVRLRLPALEPVPA